MVKGSWTASPPCSFFSLVFCVTDVISVSRRGRLLPVGTPDHFYANMCL